MPGGCIHYLRSAYASGRLHFEQVWNHFRYRIDADRHAVTGKHRLSKLGLTPTNAFLSVVPDSSVSMAVGRVRNYAVDKSLLHGIPLGVKDNFCTNFDRWGLPTTCASRALENFCAMYDASVVASLTNQGALLLGKTNMDEFAMGCGATDGVISGPVINPWCHMQQTNNTNDSYPTLIAGGSSGGSAAAIAAGLCVAALASDTGGSARIPAAHCGVVGLKPTYGLLSRHGLIPLMNAIDVPSVMSTCVSDIAAILAAWINPKDDLARTMDATCVSVSEDLVKHWHSDLNSLATGTDSDDMAQHLNKVKTPIRIGIPVEYHVPGLDPELCEHWDRMACWFADQLACDVRQVRLPHTPMTTTVYSVLCATEVASNMARYDGLKFGFRSTKNFDQENYVNSSSESQLSDTELLFSSTRSIGFGDVVRSRVFAGNFFLLRSQAGRHLEAARRLWRLIKHDFDEVFETVDFLLTPVCPSFPIPIDEFKRLDNRTRTTLDDVCTVGANLAGVPAISLPVARSTTTGLPISLQLIGPAFSEPQLLRLAAQLEMGMSFSPLVDLKKIIDNI